MVVVVKREVTEAIIRHSLYEHASSQVYLMLQTTAAPVVTAELYRLPYNMLIWLNSTKLSFFQMVVFQ